MVTATTTAVATNPVWGTGHRPGGASGTTVTATAMAVATGASCAFRGGVGNPEGAQAAGWDLRGEDVAVPGANRSGGESSRWTVKGRAVADIERTLVLVKPDGVQRGLVGEVIRRIEAKGLRLAGCRVLRMSPELARQHYAPHEGKPFFPGLVGFITSGPIVAMAWEGAGAIGAVRALMGATDPQKAAPGTLRGDLALDIGQNLVHGSDGPESAARELSLFFAPGDLVAYERAIDPWIVAP